MIGSPGMLLVLGALAVAAAPVRARKGLGLLLPAVSFADLLLRPMGAGLSMEFLGHTLVLVRVDKLSMLFGIVFHLAAILGAVYALHDRGRMEPAAALAYAGSAIGAVFAGDLLTFFVWIEIAAVSAAFVIWSAGTESSRKAGGRYLAVQAAAGVTILAGVILHAAGTGSVAFGRIGAGSAGGILILLGLGVKCAFPFLHTWLTDAYPEATPSGAVFLSAFTTKVGVYALARGFAGTEALVGIGVAMCVFPIFFAVIENDLRRVLGYSMINQIGFMVAGIGMGTATAMNGALAHAFADILFKGLLFMSMGAVLLRTGTCKASELGGLARSMPWTTMCCIVGAASISAFPLFSAFATKPLILDAAAAGHRTIVWLLMLFASAGVFHHAGIKVPFFAFFGHDSGRRCAEAPWNMRVAMGAAAALSIGIGCFPQVLYGLLPYPMDYAPYTTSHVVAQLQLLLFSALAFAFLRRTGIYPPELRSTNLDADWMGRKFLPGVWRSAVAPAIDAVGSVRAWIATRFPGWILGPPAAPAGTSAGGSAVLVVIGMLLWFLFWGFFTG